MDILIGFIGAFIGAAVTVAYKTYISIRQEKALLLVLVTEFMLLFKRCVMYYDQFLKQAVSFSSLFEISDAATVTKLAELTKNIAILNIAVELKASFFQIRRWVEKTQIFDAQTQSYSVDPRSQGKAIAFFMGELKKPDDSLGREGYINKLEKIRLLLAYLEQLNERNDFAWLVEEFDFKRTQKKKIREFINESKKELQDRVQLLEQLRQKEKQILTATGMKFS